MGKRNKVIMQIRSLKYTVKQIKWKFRKNLRFYRWRKRNNKNRGKLRL